jgi:hypothetical protein
MAAREPAASTADPAANQGEGGKETARTDGAKEAAGTRLIAMHIAGLAVLILGILVVLLIVMPEFNQDRDTATGVLGVVIPAFATIGAALFGITVGYNAGQSSGKETGKAEGKAEGEARKDEAAAVARTQGRKEVAEEVAERLERGRGRSPSRPVTDDHASEPGRRGRFRRGPRRDGGCAATPRSQGSRSSARELRRRP